MSGCPGHVGLTARRSLSFLNGHSYNCGTTRRIVTVIPHRVRLLAVILALVGQYMAAFGFPAIHFASTSKSSDHSSRCGCSAEDREAGRCCCMKTTTVHACCQPEPTPCCQSKSVKDKQAATIIWQSPVVNQQCKGPSDPASISCESPSVPPRLPAGCAIEPRLAGRVLEQTSIRLERTIAPDAPPPR